MKLKNAFPLINIGIFDYMGESPPWNQICDNVVMNNTLYFTYGERLAAPVLSYFMCNDKTPALDENTLHTIDDADANAIAQMILARYSEKWKRMLAINNAEYNPLNNYDMTEKEALSSSGKETGTRDSEYSKNAANTNTTETSVKSATDSISARTQTQSGDSDTSIYAFNSVDAVPANTANAENKTADSETGKTDANSAENVKSASSETGVGKNSENNTVNKIDSTTRTLTRSGNIGVTTSVQMLEQERNFWVWSYIRVIIEDVADFLTIGVY